MDDVTGDIKCLEQLHLQTVRLSGTKVKGSIEVFNGMKGLVVIEMEFCSAITGNPESCFTNENLLQRSFW